MKRKNTVAMESSQPLSGAVELPWRASVHSAVNTPADPSKAVVTPPAHAVPAAHWCVLMHVPPLRHGGILHQSSSRTCVASELCPRNTRRMRAPSTMPFITGPLRVSTPASAHPAQSSSRRGASRICGGRGSLDRSTKEEWPTRARRLASEQQSGRRRTILHRGRAPRGHRPSRQRRVLSVRSIVPQWPA
jgi:hypothetical protein